MADDLKKKLHEDAVEDVLRTTIKTQKFIDHVSQARLAVNHGTNGAQDWQWSREAVVLLPTLALIDLRERAVHYQ
jgi:hypothetical protein